MAPTTMRSHMNAGSAIKARGGRVHAGCPIGYHVHNWRTLDVILTVRLYNEAAPPKRGLL